MSKQCCYSQIQYLLDETNLTCPNIHFSFLLFDTKCFGTSSMTREIFSFLLLSHVPYSLPKMTASKQSQSIPLLLESLTLLSIQNIGTSSTSQFSSASKRYKQQPFCKVLILPYHFIFSQFSPDCLWFLHQLCILQLFLAPELATYQHHTKTYALTL